MDWRQEEQTAEPGRALPDAVAEKGRGEVHLQQRGQPEQGLQSEHLWLPCGAPPLQAEACQHEPARLLPLHEVPQGPDQYRLRRDRGGVCQ